MEEPEKSSEVIKLKTEDLTSSAGLKPQKRKFVAKYGRTFPKKKNYYSLEKKRLKSSDSDAVPVAESSLLKHDTGAAEINPESVRTLYHKVKLAKKKKAFLERTKQTARAEIINQEDEGFLVTDRDELTFTIGQEEICSAVDIASATKYFNLDLERFGPYRIDYTNNGRYLLLGGKRGHVAAFDWMTKKLYFETNVMEGVRDVQWLHVETMYAVAQKRWTYIYDNAGVELHCLKMLHNIKRLEYLPKHFLLVAGAKTSFLSYLDISMGKLVQSFPTKQGPLDVMTQNPSNAIIHTGHSNGTVQLWSPNVQEPLVKMLAHSCTVQGISVQGNYMATTGLDRRLRIWDVRNYKILHAYTLPLELADVTLSQRFVVACAVGNTVQIFKDAHLGKAEHPYLVQKCNGIISDLRFCPYEDVLGVGHQGGFTSLLVPGCGEANVDALHANPFESKTQRREREVKQLLDKIQPELITLDTSEIVQVNTDIMEKENERLKNILRVRPREVTYVPRKKKKGLSKEKRKQIVQDELRFNRNEEIKEAERALLPAKKEKVEGPKSVLDRFKKKDA